MVIDNQVHPNNTIKPNKYKAIENQIHPNNTINSENKYINQNNYQSI